MIERVACHSFLFVDAIRFKCYNKQVCNGFCRGLPTDIFRTVRPKIPAKIKKIETERFLDNNIMKEYNATKR